MRYWILVSVVLFGCKSKSDLTSVDVVEEVVQETVPLNSEGELIEVSTTFGDMTLLLYNETPLHKENFLKLVDSAYYDSLLFHRVIRNFMVQGGDPKSKNASKGTRLGTGGPGYTVAAEFDARFIHKKGAIAAARTGGPGNPKKRSSGSQFYFVQGEVQSAAALTNREAKIKQTNPDFAYTEEQKLLYTTVGGTPHLDMDYTVFGEIIKGINVIDSIAAVKTAAGNRPLEDVMMFIKRAN